MRISDWSSDVCSSDLSIDDPLRIDWGDFHWIKDRIYLGRQLEELVVRHTFERRPVTETSFGDGGAHQQLLVGSWTFQQYSHHFVPAFGGDVSVNRLVTLALDYEGFCPRVDRSEEHTSDLQSLMRNPYAVFS